MSEQVNIVWPDVLAIAPELSTLSTQAQDDILAHVNFALDPKVFGGVNHPKYRLARIYLAAHLGSTSRSGAQGASGPVTSESVGSISRSYGFSQASTTGLSGTAYGRQYDELLMSSVARVPLVF